MNYLNVFVFVKDLFTSMQNVVSGEPRTCAQSNASTRGTGGWLRELYRDLPYMHIDTLLFMLSTCSTSMYHHVVYELCLRGEIHFSDVNHDDTICHVIDDHDVVDDEWIEEQYDDFYLYGQDSLDDIACSGE